MPLNLIRNNHKFKEKALQSRQEFYLVKRYNTYNSETSLKWLSYSLKD